MRIFCFLFFVFCFSSVRSDGLQQEGYQRKFITFGTNTPWWTERMRFSEIRMACSLTPLECLNRARNIYTNQKVSTINMTLGLNLESNDYFNEFMMLYDDNAYIGELSFDDFSVGYRNGYKKNGVNFKKSVEGAIDTVKSVGVKFGITLYEDDINQDVFNENVFSEKYRKKIDYIHFYLHYRVSYVDYEKYLDKIGVLFPNAKVIGGVYALDRVDYISCAINSSRKCTQFQDYLYFKKLISVQSRLLKNGRLVGVEFYPAYFGNEEKWEGWSSDKICKKKRKEVCLKNTKKMRRGALIVFSENMAVGS